MDGTTELIKWAENNVPTGDEEFDEAWARVSAESPAEKPENCPLLRGLVQAKMETIRDLRQTA